MNNTNTFTIIVIGVALALAAAGVLLLSGIIPGFSLGKSGGAGPASQLVIWGNAPSDYFQGIITDINQANKDSFSISYVQKNSATYESELIDALAAARGPDIFFLPQDLILKHKNKIFPIPFESFSERNFKDTFIQEGELFLLKDGAVAMPFLINPMVLYWNRDLFSGAGLASAPKTWDEFLNFSQKLTVFDSSGNIIQSGAALGEFKNIDYAKDIISLLILQTGNPIVDSVTLKSALAEQAGALNPAEATTRFFLEFSDPAKTSYSWNASLIDSKNAFIAGSLAMYFGYSGEYNDIKSKNPHLNFDAAPVPQIKNSPTQATFGKITGLAISKSSANIPRAASAVYQLINQDSISKLTEAAFLAPVRRDLLSQAAKDPVLAVFYKAGIQARGWLEPDSASISAIFENMVQSVKTGKSGISDAVSSASQKLNILLAK